MSKAFTRESDDAPDLPVAIERATPLPPGAKNYLTRRGAEGLREEMANLIEKKRPKFAGSEDPETKRQLTAIDRRIAELEQSLQSAEIIDPADGATDRVRFGTTVSVRDEKGDVTTYRIVGVDETDADRGWVSWLSPIAKALLNARRGDRVRFRFPSGEEYLEIVDVS